MVRGSLVLVALTGLIAGCGSGNQTDRTAPPPRSTAPAAPPSVVDERLLDREWRLESFGAVGDEKPLVADSRIALTFNEDGTLDGFAGCNTYRTTYRSGSAGELTVRALVRSNDECSAAVMQQETTYLDVLHRVESYEVSPDQLLLFYEGGDRDLVYRAIAPDGDAAASDRPTSSSDSGARGSRRTSSP